MDTLGIGTIANIAAWRFSAQCTNSRDHPTMKLEIVIRIKQVMFAVILIFGCNCNACKHVTKSSAGISSKDRACVCVAPPIDIRFGKISRILPIPLINQRQDSRAIRTGFGTKDPIVSIFTGWRRIMSPFCIACDVSLDMSPHVIFLQRFVESSNYVYRFIEHTDKVRKGITEEARNTADHI